MVSSLVGYTGFVGSNLNNKFEFTHRYNSKNIKDGYDSRPDLLVYAGVRAEKFLANQYPQKDFESVEEAFENIKKINPKQLVLISTIDVYKNPVNVDEDTIIDIDELHPYGLNRYHLEQWVQNEYKNSLIIRLPGLYGENIKKNFIYDLINVIPSMLTANKFNELLKTDSILKDYYTLQDNGFYKCRELSSSEHDYLKKYFEKIGFTALNFTDNRGSFQFYNLKYLWEHISIALDNKINKLNLATEPVTISEIYEKIKHKEFINEVASVVPNYNFKTKYSELFNGGNGYIFTKDEILSDISMFVEGYVK